MVQREYMKSKLINRDDVYKERISVIMGVYNCKDTIKEAINSLLEQTYTNWELIICDDASTDQTYEILQKYVEQYPKKIILLRNKENKKLSYTLNRCLEHTSGLYIARMDGDDISAPERFEKQIKYLKENPEIDLVGTGIQRFDKSALADIISPSKEVDKYSLKDGVPFIHATIMTYKYVYTKLKGYTVSQRTVRGQDLDLWFRFYNKGFNGGNILEPLYFVRENKSAVKRRTIKVRYNAYKTTLLGYRLLQYPIHWYVKPTLSFFIKSLVPTKIILLYRKYQAYVFKKTN